MERQELIALLETLLLTHSPSGHEGEIDEVLLPHFERLLTDVQQDSAGNIIGLPKGESSDAPLGIVTHKDELGMSVKRVLPDGKAKLRPTSSAQPGVYGVAVGARRGTSTHPPLVLPSRGPATEGCAARHSPCWPPLYQSARLLIAPP